MRFGIDLPFYIYNGIMCSYHVTFAEDSMSASSGLGKLFGLRRLFPSTVMPEFDPFGTWIQFVICDGAQFAIGRSSLLGAVI